jgi:predicted ATPase
LPPPPDPAPPRFVISGNGKYTLIAALAERAFQTFPKPGRIIVQAETAIGGTALPWKDTAAFASRAIAMSLANWEASGPILSFHDRSYIDQFSWFAASVTRLQADYRQIATIHRFETKVLLVPPRPALCQSGAERPHGVATATREYEALRHFHPALGFTITLAPQTSVAEKIAFILSHTATTAS